MIKPLGNRVLVKSSDVAKTTATGIIIPDSASESTEPKTGVIVAVGTDMKESLEVGMKVMYGKYSGFLTTIEKEKHMLLSVDDVLGIVED